MEQEIIRLFKASQGSESRDEVQIGIGDDGAILNVSQRETVWVTDTITEGVHFDLDDGTLQQVGRKALAVNLSDIAAMGARPVAALVTLVLPKSMTMGEIKKLAQGMCKMASAFDVAIVGGDTNRHDGPLVVGVAISGTVDVAKAWRLDGARAGDSLLVTGKLGGSILGRHLDFQPRTSLASYVASNYEVHAATDISDSLAVDLGHMVQCSGVSAVLLTDRVPISSDAEKLSMTSQRSALDHALFDGEDFELLLSMSADAASELVADQQARELSGGGIVVIGRVESGSKGAIVDQDGIAIAALGYEH